MITMVATGIPPLSNLIASFVYLADASLLEIANFAIFMIVFGLFAPVFTLGALRYAGIEYVNQKDHHAKLQIKIFIIAVMYVLSIAFCLLSGQREVSNIDILLLVSLLSTYNLFETLRLIIVSQRKFSDLLKINILFSLLNIISTYSMIALLNQDPNFSRILSLIIAYLLPSLFLWKFLGEKIEIANLLCIVKEARRLAKLGTPVALGALPFWFILNSDRIILKTINSLELLGVLGSVYLLANLATIIIQVSINYVTGEYVQNYERFTKVENRKFLTKLLMICLVWYVPFAIIYYSILWYLNYFGIIFLSELTVEWLPIILFAGVFKIFVAVSSLYNDTAQASNIRLFASVMSAGLLMLVTFPILLIEKPAIFVVLPILGCISISLILFFGTERKTSVSET